ncbi:MAG: hypothetical protein Ct9H300mP1_29720 [Planctomycetaceae bacterium]|nr:MAG: hypothetical protein Ct9H300mP1_29720 [Planctomycetaceae bacterium]
MRRSPIDDSLNGLHLNPRIVSACHPSTSSGGRIPKTHLAFPPGFLRAGGLGLAGLSLADLLSIEAQSAPRTTNDNSVLILWMRGGPSQHETWDPKMKAPAEYRGAFGSTRTSVPGIEICDMLPRRHV